MKRVFLRAGLTLLLFTFVWAGWKMARREIRTHAPGRTVISFAHHHLEPGVREAFAEMAARYEALHPNVDVVPLAIPERVYPSWLRTQLFGGTAPQLIEMGPALSDELLARYFQPLGRELSDPNPYNAGTPLAGEPWRSTFLDGLDGGLSFRSAFGDNFGVGNTIFTTRVFYNADLMREIFGHTRPPADFREMLEYCERIEAFALASQRNLVPFAASRPNTRPLLVHLFTSATQRLLQRLDAGGGMAAGDPALARALLRGEWSLESPEIAAGLSLVRSVARHFQPGFLQLQREDAVFLFSQQAAVFLITGSWDASSLETTSAFEIGAFRIPLPTRDDPEYGAFVLGPTPEGGITYATFAVRRDAPHREQAIDFLRFMSSWDENRRFAERSQWLPALREVPPAPSVRHFMPQPGTHPRGVGIDVFPAHTEHLIHRNYHLLLGRNGSVDTFVNETAEAYVEAVKTGLERSVQTQTRSIATQDLVLGALALLAEQDASHADRLAWMLDTQSHQEMEVLLSLQALKEPSPSTRSEPRPRTP